MLRGENRESGVRSGRPVVVVGKLVFVLRVNGGMTTLICTG